MTTRSATTLDEWIPATVILIDNAPKLVDAWKRSFAAIPEVIPLAGDYFQRPADAMVSPANSFGIMDGGLDLAIRDQLGYPIQGKVQAMIVDQYHGELPVGCAEVVETGDARWKYLVVAPTMRVPEPVAFGINAYLAFRAILVAVARFNRNAGARRIDSLVCCGLGTGVGGMEPAKCAGQMLMAYKALLMPSAIGRFESIHKFHHDLKNL